MDKDFFDVPDALSRHIEPLLPPERGKPKGGRPRIPERVVDGTLKKDPAAA